MYELMQAGPCSYYMDCPSKVGFIVLGALRRAGAGA